MSKPTGMSHAQLRELRRKKRILELQLRIARGQDASGWSPTQLKAVYNRVVKGAKVIQSAGATADKEDTMTNT